MTEAALSKPRLLAIDDNADSAQLISRVAAKCDYEAKHITYTRDLQRLLAEWQPQVLTLDLCMKEDDGISVLSLLQENGFAGSLLIISGQDDWLRKSAARLASARGLNITSDLPKPVDLKLLREILMKLHARASQSVSVLQASSSKRIVEPSVGFAV